MKLIFLDFDGVLNSTQECVYKRNRQSRSWYWRTRERLANSLCLRYKRHPDGRWTSRRDPLGILGWMSDFAREHVSDLAEFCPIACSNLQRLLVKNPDIRIVVSSVWRSDGVPRLRQIFRRNGIDPSRIIDVTPYGNENEHGETIVLEAKDNYKAKVVDREMIGRGTQIQKWLGSWKRQGGETVTHFVIIDDDSDMVHLKDRLVQTNGHHGFMRADLVQVAAMLEAVI